MPVPTPVLIFHGFALAVLAVVYLTLTVTGHDGTIVLGALLAQVVNSGAKAGAAVAR